MIGLCIIVTLILLLILLKNHRKSVEDFANYTLCDRLPLYKRFETIFSKYNINKDKEKWDIYLPCGYTHVEKELLSLPQQNSEKKIFAISGCDQIVSKLHLWKVLKNKFPNTYSNYFPKTYLFDRQGVTDLISKHKPGDKYIAKKDVQRQTGLKIIHSILDFKDIRNDRKYLVVQELLKNPLLVNERKLNLRIYFLIVCKNGNTTAYIHDNGFIYYTPEMFNYESKNDKAHITTGYIDRSVYATNPLTIDDLYVHLTRLGVNSKTLRNNILHLFKTIVEAIKIPLCKNSKLNDSITFQLFGCDIAPDNNLNVKLIEINKGPDLSAKDKRDDMVKHEITLDMFEIVEIIPKQEKDNRFVRIS